MQTRLQVIIAKAGIASRRKAEELIAAGKVSVNNVIVSAMGSKADPLKDQIVVNGKPLHTISEKLLFRVNKPPGVRAMLTETSSFRSVPDLFQGFWQRTHPGSTVPRMYPISTLDEDDEGLMLLTNDGDIVYRMTHPKFDIPKTYEVLVQGAPSNASLNALRKGVLFKEGRALCDELGILRHEDGNTWLKVSIHQNMHRQLKRMCARVGMQVLYMRCTKYADYDLENLNMSSIEPVALPTK